VAIVVIKLLIVITLIFVIVEDLKNYRIRNKNIGILLLETLFLIIITKGIGDLYWHFVLATLALTVLIFSYHRQFVGGGDAKLIAVAFLYVGPSSSLLFAIALLLCTLLYWLAVKADLVPFQRIGGRIRVPFGPSVASAWIVTMLASAAL